jgi:acyl carrier protein
MEPDDIERQIIELIAKRKKLDPSAVTLDTAFADIGVDSLDAIELVFTFEDTFNISVPDEAVQQVKTVRDVVDAVRMVAAGRTAEPS